MHNLSSWYGVILFPFTLTFSALLQLLSIFCISSTKVFILDLSTLLKAVWRTLSAVLMPVLFCRRYLIALDPKIASLIFCVTKNDLLISVDLIFFLILTLISTHPAKGMSLSSAHWTLMVSQSARIELIC